MHNMIGFCVRYERIMWICVPVHHTKKNLTVITSFLLSFNSCCSSNNLCLEFYYCFLHCFNILQFFSLFSYVALYTCECCVWNIIMKRFVYRQNMFFLFDDLTITFTMVSVRNYVFCF